jgi:hypothetical protein
MYNMAHEPGLDAQFVREEWMVTLPVIHEGK